MILFLLFIVVPLCELYTIVKMSAAIGFFNTLGVMIVIGAIGSWLVKREGMRVWQKFNTAVGQGKVPTKEIIDGVLILGAGALLLTPGFLSDIFGLLMLFPPTRVIFRGFLLRRAGKKGRFASQIFHESSNGPQGSGDFIDGDATEIQGELD
ncbi:MAG: FxsA family protein [Ilumatobacteraceae bacterium]|nr:FxsA family protein [Ilumatobacteraceae bacterium]